MSVMRCESCEAMIDTDYHVEDIVIWDGPHGCCCLKCFEKLDCHEAWNLALETVLHEMTPYKLSTVFTIDALKAKLKELQH